MVQYEDFRGVFVIGSAQLTEQVSWVETNGDRTLTHVTSGIISKT